LQDTFKSTKLKQSGLEFHPNVCFHSLWSDFEKLASWPEMKKCKTYTSWRLLHSDILHFLVIDFMATCKVADLVIYQPNDTKH